MTLEQNWSEIIVMINHHQCWIRPIAIAIRTLEAKILNVEMFSSYLRKRAHRLFWMLSQYMKSRSLIHISDSRKCGPDGVNLAIWCSDRCDHKQASKWDQNWKLTGWRIRPELVSQDGAAVAADWGSSLLFSRRATQKEIELNFVPADITLIRAAGNW